ncbi:3-ketoacyl-(acyl-carrier-protein) reductase [Roseovarius sp. A-2]|uniref:hypothetical protein n=1 Tax=Roseovarius sp. A-2 TaxID=1570360 RepID=UPI0009C93F95|nr:hypothetical protein [Roseovarius sp. A-2]GAW34150.1 3-ketoacyl-(acyl-carrier-protein) reductase [Roseovarius sp. A-2]
MEQTLASKTALVTAAAHGNGRAGAPAMAARGAQVIAEMVCYLAGDMSEFPTGQALAIDRGWSN